MEKYKTGQKELSCLCSSLWNAYDRVPREELQYA